jgi:hypothetical protein
MLSTRTFAAAGWRRIALALAITLVAVLASFGIANAQAAPPAPAAAPAQAAAAPQTRVFTGDFGMLSYVVKGDKVAEFEALLGKLKEGLAKSEKPERKAQAAGWRVIKQAEPRSDGNVNYLFVIDPVVKDADYTMSTILYEAFPTERQAIYDAIRACVAGSSAPVNYNTVMPAAK